LNWSVAIRVRKIAAGAPQIEREGEREVSRTHCSGVLATRPAGE
jgi:hypothetical protein